jgi:hypothetical protein
MSKVCQPSKVPTKIYALCCAHVSFKINMSLIQTTRPPPPENQQRPPEGAPQLEENLCSSVTTATTEAHQQSHLVPLCYSLQVCFRHAPSPCRSLQQICCASILLSFPYTSADYRHWFNCPSKHKTRTSCS